MAEDFEDWEEWDPSKGSFAHHMLAGSCAGLAEHTLMFPVDTVKTMMQVKAPEIPRCSAENVALCQPACQADFVKHTLQREGFWRMWRGVQTMLAGCIPAHAAYFSLYEASKEYLTRNCTPGQVPLAAGVAVTIGTMAHDAIMTPMDVCKQRLQLGYHHGMWDCLKSIVRREGARALLVSYPTTLFMNVPYALVMGTANESLRGIVNPSGQHSSFTYFVAGAGSGVVAAAVTTPLDVAKTRLQTQAYGLPPMRGQETSPASTATWTKAASMNQSRQWVMGTPSSLAAPAVHCTSAFNPTASGPHARSHMSMPSPSPGAGGHQQYTGMVQTLKLILREEGAGVLMRGMVPRILVHAPSVAISWTTYEIVKHTLTTL